MRITRSSIATLSSHALAGLILNASPGAGHAQEPDSCEVLGSTLATARTAYALECAGIPRVDCDPVIGGWACASYRIGPGAPSFSSAGSDGFGNGVAQEAASVPEVGETVGVGECSWIAATLASARAGYAANCVVERADCDPVAEGWMCSSDTIGVSRPDGGIQISSGAESSSGNNAAPSNGSSSAQSPGDSSADSSTGSSGVPSNDSTGVYSGAFGAPSVNWADSYSANGVCYPDTNGDHGVYELAVSTPVGTMSVREAIDLLESGPGIARADALYNDVRCGNGPANNAGDEDREHCPGRVDQGVAGCQVIGPDWQFR